MCILQYTVLSPSFTSRGYIVSKAMLIMLGETGLSEGEISIVIGKRGRRIDFS